MLASSNTLASASVFGLGSLIGALELRQTLGRAAADPLLWPPHAFDATDTTDTLAMRHLSLLLALRAVVAQPAAVGSPNVDHSCVEALHLGVRRYHLWRPRAHGVCGQAPVVVVLIHGFGGTPLRAWARTAKLVQARGWAAAAPYGHHKSWNGAACCGDAAKQNLDDVGFLQKLVEDVRDRTGADRVFGAGFSNGGYMLTRAAHLFDGISPWGGHQTHLNTTRPTPMTMHHGLKDGVVKVTGCCSGAKCCCGIDKRSDECVHFFGVFERWLRLNRCASHKVVESTHATCRVGVSCRANTTACLHKTMSHVFNDLARPSSNDMRGPSVVDVLDFFSTTPARHHHRHRHLHRRRGIHVGPPPSLERPTMRVEPPVRRSGFFVGAPAN